MLYNNQKRILYKVLFISNLVFIIEMLLVHYNCLFGNKEDIFLIVYLLKNLIVYMIIFCVCCLGIFIFSKLKILYKWHIIFYHLQYILISIYLFFLDELMAMSAYRNFDFKTLIMLPFFPILSGLAILLVWRFQFYYCLKSHDMVRKNQDNKLK